MPSASASPFVMLATSAPSRPLFRASGGWPSGACGWRACNGSSGFPRHTNPRSHRQHSQSPIRLLTLVRLEELDRLLPIKVAMPRAPTADRPVRRSNFLPVISNDPDTHTFLVRDTSVTSNIGCGFIICRVCVFRPAINARTIGPENKIGLAFTASSSIPKVPKRHNVAIFPTLDSLQGGMADVDAF
jgi:hypothetical protein